MGHQIEIRIKLLLTFRERAPNGVEAFTMELPPRTTVGQALALLSIQADEAKVIILNGRLGKEGLELKNGDKLTVFPPMEGG